MKKVRATADAFHDGVPISKGAVIEIEDDFNPPWAEPADADDTAISPVAGEQEAMNAVIEPDLPTIRDDSIPLPPFHPTVRTEAEASGKVDLAVEAATAGDKSGDEVIATARNPSASPKKPSAKKDDKSGNDLAS